MTNRWKVAFLVLTWDLLCLLPEWLIMLIGVVVITGLGAGLLVVSGAYVSTTAILITVGFFGVGAVVFVASRWTQRSRWRYPRLSLDDHPELRDVVADAARLAGFNTVPQVRLMADAKSGANRRWLGKPIVWIGLPLLIGLNKADLHTVLVRQLLAGKWGWYEGWAVHLYLNHFPNRAWLREACRPIRKAVWAQAGAVVGSDRLAAASRAEWLVQNAFTWHSVRYVTPFMERGSVVDYYDSFRWKVHADGLLTRISPRAEDIAPEELDLYGEGAWTTNPAPTHDDRIALDLTDSLERQLSEVIRRTVLNFGLSIGAAKPIRVAERSEAEWQEFAELHRASVIEAASNLLGRPAVDGDVVKLVVAGRAGELEWWHRQIACPHPTPGVCALMPLFDVALRRAGYTHEHVFAQRVLVGPTGDQVNLVELAGKAERGEPYDEILPPTA